MSPAADNTGGPLALAALATAAGFLSFTPTAYKGCRSLGEIAGVGMIVAFITSITVLPALLRLLNPPGEPIRSATLFWRRSTTFLKSNRMAVLIGTLAL